MMTRVTRLLVLAAICSATVTLLTAAEPPAPWAFGFTTPPGSQEPPGTMAVGAPADTIFTVPGSTLKMTREQVLNFFNAGDWFPDDHPKMPYIVQYGRAPDVIACGVCHLINGKGRTEHSPVAGLPVEYFIQQLHDFKNDLREHADPRKSMAGMTRIAKALTEAEMRDAAEYYGKLPWDGRWITVVESDVVPKTRRTPFSVWVRLDTDPLTGKPVPGNQTEPLGNRIMEIPTNTLLFDLHYTRPEGGLTAYVPVGSVKKGEALANSGAKVTRCSVCHGAGLEGLGAVPPIAGRGPSYIARQLYNYQHRTRRGPWAALMSAAVDPLTADDILNLTAYVSSLPVADGTRR
jgi:cytochrome c553